MNNNEHSKSSNNDITNDPRLTAYALGEMDADERTVFEAEIRDNPVAQSAIAEIRATAGQLETALAHEPASEIEEDWRAAREAEAARARRQSDPYAKKSYGFPYFIISGLAGVLFTVLFFTILLPDFKKATNTLNQPAVPATSATVINGKTYQPFDLNTVTDGALAATTPAPADALTVSNTASAISFFPPAPQIAKMPANTASQDIATTINYNSPYLFKGANGGDDAKFALGSALVTGSASNNIGDKTLNGGMLWRGTPASESTGVYVNATAPEPLIMSAFTVSRTPPSTNAESYTHRPDNDFQRVSENPLSTFSADVDTASYTNIRRFLTSGRLPPTDAVRIEEMLNYFTYDDAPPAKDSVAPFAATMEVASAPWNPEHRLVRIGIKGRELDNLTRPPANLVFLLDVSGSMDEPNKLPLVKESMRMLIGKLRPDDRIAIVTYSGATGLALASTPVSNKEEIFAVLDSLRADGGTNGGAGIQLAYDIAKANFIKDGANRVILCTDGNFNVGVTSPDALTRMIEEKVQSGVCLSVLGFGMGNFKDSMLQRLADKGNGNYGYIDNREEARRLFVERTAATLVTIARDVKLQVEFNPAQVAAYRLIGYEKRALAKEDFNNDKVSAGAIGAGHTVTALYEIIPARASDSDTPAQTTTATNALPPVDPLKYQTQITVSTTQKADAANELLTLKIRYKLPASDTSDKIEYTLKDEGATFASASADFKFASAVAGFGMLLRNSPDKGDATYDAILAWGEPAIGADPQGQRAEFFDLVRRARQL